MLESQARHDSRDPNPGNDGAAALDPIEKKLQAELRAMFEVDTQEGLQTYLNLAPCLQSETWSRDINTLYRTIHTIKGGAVTVNADGILHVATALEDLLSDLRYLDPPPPLEDGQLGLMLQEAGELLAGILSNGASGVSERSVIRPILDRLEVLHSSIEQIYLPDFNEQTILHQEFAEHGFDLVVLDLEMALENLSEGSVVPPETMAIARETLDQLQQAGKDLQFESGWEDLLQWGQDLLAHSETPTWASQMGRLLKGLKTCAKQGGLADATFWEEISQPPQEQVPHSGENLSSEPALSWEIGESDPALWPQEAEQEDGSDGELGWLDGLDFGDSEVSEVPLEWGESFAAADEAAPTLEAIAPEQLAPEIESDHEAPESEADAGHESAAFLNALTAADESESPIDSSAQEQQQEVEDFPAVLNAFDNLEPVETEWSAGEDDFPAVLDAFDNLEPIETEWSAGEDDLTPVPDIFENVEAIVAPVEGEEQLPDFSQIVPVPSPSKPQPVAPESSTAQDKDKENIQVPVPLERLDRSAQYLVDALLSVRATKRSYKSLQNQLVQLIALAQEEVQHIARLRQIQDDYALLNDVDRSDRLTQEPTLERYRQGYGTINRLLETSLRLSEIGAEAEQSAQIVAESLQHLDGNIRQLQHTVEDSRLVPFRNLGFRVKAIVRDLTARYSKPARIEIQGEAIELDIGTARTLEPALLHLIRNAYDHGLETPQERIAAGKPDRGTISLSLRRRGNSYVLELGDDGRGIDVQGIQKRARTLGLPLTQTETAADLLAVISQPGFSSRTEANEVSGRGVGMDVVLDRIAYLGGRLSLETHPGRGTTFRLEFPVPHLLVPCVLVRAGDRVFAIAEEEIETTSWLGDLEVVPLERRDRAYSRTVKSGEAKEEPGFDLLEYWQPQGEIRPLDENGIGIYIRLPESGQGIWLLADELLEQSDLSIESLPAPLVAPVGLMGITLQADGSSIPVLEATALAQGVAIAPQVQPETASQEPGGRSIETTRTLTRTILVVDDAALMRRRIEFSLNAYGYTTHTCTDGLEAWNWLQANPQPALIVTDIEMPNMDGFTLIDRARAAGMTLPILVVSSRLSEEWSHEARRLGATDYLTKGFSTPELVNKISSLLKAVSA